jgi:hypothetical protein
MTVDKTVEKPSSVSVYDLCERAAAGVAKTVYMRIDS